MRKSLFLWIFLAVALAAALNAAAERSASSKAAAQVQTPATPSTAQAPPSPPSIPTPSIPSAPAISQLTIVIDAAHGGADNGARGPNGVNEKDIVLALARGMRAELTQRGYRVSMTRDSDSDPTYDERAAMSNAFANPLFISVHVASTGASGTVHTYFYRAAAPFTAVVPPAVAAAQGEETGPAAAMPVPLIPSGGAGMIPWRQAQAPFVDASHRFADLVQSAAAQKFSASPENGTPASVRELRSVAAPAIAIEVSSISNNPSVLESMSPPLAAAVAQAIQILRPGTVAENGGGQNPGSTH